MTTGSMLAQYDHNGRRTSNWVSAHFHRPVSDRPHRVIHYDKQFDVSQSRLPDKAAKIDSMVAYSRKMRSIQLARYANGHGKNMFVRAKHIPKCSDPLPKKRRPMSFDELLGRNRELAHKESDEVRKRPHSENDKLLNSAENDTRPTCPTENDTRLPRLTENNSRLPRLTEKIRTKDYKVQVGMVSASHFYNMVDFSLKSKNTIEENLLLKNMEAAEKNTSKRKQTKARDRHEEVDISGTEINLVQRNKEEEHVTQNASGNVVSPKRKQSLRFGDTTIPGASCNQTPLQLAEITSMSKNAQSPSQLLLMSIDILRYRPKRVQRMKLQDPSLGHIPEDMIIEAGKTNQSVQTDSPRTVTSPPPPILSPKPLENLAKPPLDAIAEQCEINNCSSAQTYIDQTNVVPNDELTYSRIELERKDGQPNSRNYFEMTDEQQSSRIELERNDELPCSSNDLESNTDIIPTTNATKSAQGLTGKGAILYRPTKQEPVNTKLRAQKRFRRIILRDRAK